VDFDRWLESVRRLLAISILCSGLLGSAAWATDPGRAETLIEQANRLRSRGQDQKALPLMKEAYDLAPSPRTAGQLGLAELAVGYWLEADRHLDEALAAPTHPWVAKNRAALRSAQKSARSHLVSVTLDGEPAGAEVMANGQPVGQLPLPNLVLAEGRITFAVRAPGYDVQTKQVTLTGGGQSRLTFELQRVRVEPGEKMAVPGPVQRNPVEGSATPVRVDRSEKPTVSEPARANPGQGATPNRTLPIVLGAAAGVALGFGIWEHLAWANAASKFEAVDGCYAGLPMRGTDSQCQGLYDSITTHRALTFVGYGAAGLLAVGSGISYWLGSASAKAPSEKASLSVTHVALGRGPGSVSVQLTGRF